MVLRTLFRVLEFYDGLGRVRAKYRGSEGERLLLEVDDEVTPYVIKPDVSLLRSFRDVSYSASEVPITLGDRVYYRLSDDGAIDVLEVIANQRGVSDDRYFSEYRWEKRYTHEEMEKRLKSRLDVGRLDDIRATRHGVSRRVVEIRITGSRGSFSIKGFPIRTALGIRENLFTIDRVRDAKGRVESFFFTGKGWGHGVGMCQVGAYGMALRGKSYEEILTHYYTGARLTPGSAVIDTRRAADDNRATGDPNSFHQP
jgi:stage II sporulation protein D